MNAYYCFWGRDGRFYASEEYIEDNPFEAFYIEMVKAENKEIAEALCKQIMKERFKAL